MALVLLMVASLVSVAKSDPFEFRLLDEDGHGQIKFKGGDWVNFNGKLMDDPTKGIKGKKVLTWILPNKGIPVYTGDLLVLEPKSPTTDSDLVRFTNAKGDLNGLAVGDRFLLYSDIPEKGEPMLAADIGIPSTTTETVRREIGDEGANHFVYDPQKGDIGGPGVGDGRNDYLFVSDGVFSPSPEPASIILIAIGGGAAILYRLSWQRSPRTKKEES
jgi:hypothetical protein